MLATRSRGSLRRRAVLLVAALAAAAGLLAAGRWTATGGRAAPASPRPGAAAAGLDTADDRGARFAAAVRRLLEAQPPAAVAPAPAVTPAPGASPADVAAAATQRARARLDALRGEMISRCWPPPGLAREPELARLTFNVTYGPDGRAIARGISVDRRTPAGALGRCLREFPLEAISIPPPGTTVAVRHAMTFP